MVEATRGPQADPVEERRDMSPFAQELCERSRRDNAMIVGSEVRGLCMEIVVAERERDEARKLLRECNDTVTPFGCELRHKIDVFLGKVKL